MGTPEETFLQLCLTYTRLTSDVDRALDKRDQRSFVEVSRYRNGVIKRLMWLATVTGDAIRTAPMDGDYDDEEY